VRCTYDTPEVADSRRMVEQAEQQMDEIDYATDNEFGVSEEESEWQDE
jgi:hypothetical protein